MNTHKTYPFGNIIEEPISFPDITKDYRNIQTEKPRTGLTLSEIIGIQNPLKGGNVTVYGDGINGKPKIGLGVMHALKFIPEEGISLEDLGIVGNMPADTYKNWLKESLIPNGLVEETEKDSGIYTITAAARNASYDVTLYKQ